MLQIVNSKLDEKMIRLHLSLFHIPFLSYCPSIITTFLQFWGYVSKKSNFLAAIFIYASDGSYGTLPGKVFVYYAMTYCFGYISI